jgi:hypothetical protein
MKAERMASSVIHASSAGAAGTAAKRPHTATASKAARLGRMVMECSKWRLQRTQTRPYSSIVAETGRLGSNLRKQMDTPRDCSYKHARQ